MSTLPPLFATTRWTLVLRARGETPEARKALGELCEAYWDPVFRFLRREGRSEDAARELTQEFFARLLARAGMELADPARGLFRSYLLGAVKHFLSDLREREGRQKRGGGETPESLDAPAPGASTPRELADPVTLPDDALFDRAWAMAVMQRAVRALEAEHEAAGKKAQFEALQGWLGGAGADCSQSEAARRLGMSEGAVKVAVHRLRKRLRELIRAEIEQTVPDAAGVDEELRYLIEVLGRAGS